MRQVACLAGVALLATVGLLITELVSAQAPAVVPPPALVTSPTYVELPPPQQEIITVPQAPENVWVPGGWERTPDQWSWVAGRWVTPPFRQAYWIPGYWQHSGGKFRWAAGHWAAGSVGAVVTQKVAMPAPIAEVQPAAPANLTNAVWAPGHWEWRGTWVWVPGEYHVVANPQAVWVAGAWDAAADGSWRWNPAHWAVKG